MYLNNSLKKSMSICNFKLQIGEVECIDAQVKLFIIHLYSTSISLL